MTEKFIETVGYVIDGELQVRHHEFEGEDRFGVLAIKKGDDGLYHRRLTEAILNLNAEVLQHTITPRGTNLSEKQIRVLWKLASFCGYFVGSTSWQENEIKDYDKPEFRHRLETIIQELE